MKQKVIWIYVSIIVMLALVGCLYGYSIREYVEKDVDEIEYVEEWDGIIASVVNNNTFKLTVDGKEYCSSKDDMYMSKNRNIMLNITDVIEAFGCATNYYEGSRVKVEKGVDVISMSLDKNQIVVNGVVALSNSMPEIVDGKAYVPVDVLCDTLGYTYAWDGVLNSAVVNNLDSTRRTLPYSYSYLKNGRAPSVKDQGQYGTCWAFAALTALESSLLPENSYDFSEDHMSLNNSFNIMQNEGGDYNMAIAYLTSWQGPVLEEDDPYGDGITNGSLNSVMHVQEVQLIEGKNIEEVKEMIFKYGGVESSIYMAGTSNNIRYSGFYNHDENSYCYIGTQKPNHDVVIIGWDDNYPKENFATVPEANGAFICRNSWGKDFGDEGNFYVSYYDTNIAVHSLVYTKVEPSDNYNNIYQSDLCGMVGMLGYGKETAYFANVYTANKDELIRSVGMYAVDKDTDYSIYVIPMFESEQSLNKRGEAVVEGSFKNSGYYTVDLTEPVKINKGDRFAVVVKINTPNCERPVAVEYVSNYQTNTVDITDGEGYISLRGIEWENTETNQECNICLKVYTDDVQ